MGSEEKPSISLRATSLAEPNVSHYIDGILSNPQEIDISVLQGTILGPILFLCFINDLPNSSKLLTYLFADDTRGLASGKNLPELIDRVNNELKKWGLLVHI